MNDKILAWFSGPQDQKEGIELLRQFGKFPAKAPIFNILTKKNKMDKLRILLAKAGKIEKTSLLQLNISRQALAPDPISAPGFKDWPDEMKALVQYRGELSKKRGILHTKRASIGTGNDDKSVADRLSLSNEIMAIDATLDQIRTVVDIFMKDGLDAARAQVAAFAASEKASSPLSSNSDAYGLQTKSVADLNKRAGNLKTYISKKGTDLAKFTADDSSEKKQKLHAAIAQHEEELAAITEFIAKL